MTMTAAGYVPGSWRLAWLALPSSTAFPGTETLFNGGFASKKRLAGSSAVEKPLDMHRIGCAKMTYL